MLEQITGLMQLVIGGLAIAWLVSRGTANKLRQCNARLAAERDDALRRIASIEADAEWMAATRERARERSISLPENQIDAVNDNAVTFSTKSVMNKGEYRAFRAANEALSRVGKSGWRVFPQVSLGEILRTNSHIEWKSDRAHRSVNSKRCDLLVVDRNGYPHLVVEYQGEGHFQGDAELRDAVKRAALDRAGVRYVETFPGDDHQRMVAVIMGAL